MKALSIERSICEGERDVKELFEFVSGHAEGHWFSIIESCLLPSTSHYAN